MRNRELGYSAQELIQPMLFHFKLSWIALGLIIGSEILDLFTTVILLGRGFVELNPLYYTLGFNGFLISGAILTTLACSVIYIMDHIPFQNFITYQPELINKISITALCLTFSLIHLIPAIRQLIWILGPISAIDALNYVLVLPVAILFLAIVIITVRRSTN